MKKLISILFLSLIYLILFSSCKGRRYLPSLEKFNEDSKLMLNISRKFANEKEAKKLNKAAVATQQARLITCVNVIGECDAYGEFISKVIKSSDDGKITSQERKEMLSDQRKLAKLLRKAKVELKKLIRKNL